MEARHGGSGVVRVLCASRQAVLSLCRRCRELLESYALGVRIGGVVRILCRPTLQQDHSFGTISEQNAFRILWNLFSLCKLF